MKDYGTPLIGTDTMFHITSKMRRMLMLCSLLIAVMAVLVTAQYAKGMLSPAAVPDGASTPVEWRSVVKYKDVLNPHMEGTPFVWKDKLYYFVSERGDTPASLRLSIYDFTTRQRIALFAEHQQLLLGSAFVDGNTFYAFATKNHTEYGKSQIYMIQSKDLRSFSKPLLIYHAPEKQQIFNTSVTRNSDTGEYVMAFETTTKGELTPFTVYFLKSKDIVRWALVDGVVFGKDMYVASPTLKYLDKWYYLWFLMKEYNDPNCPNCTTYVTKIARSKDLSTWQTSPHFFMVPDRSDEGINVSDVDLTEFNNRVYILYAVGDQDKWTNMRLAVYDGTLRSLVQNFFPKEASSSASGK